LCLGGLESSFGAARGDAGWGVAADAVREEDLGYWVGEGGGDWEVVGVAIGVEEGEGLVRPV